ncbi:TetR family transcriptional regulator C-terminal domain-containing protein [Actinoalloteichus caeruleus]|uniref:TetR family transcriptional regulator C-terminal domain-containing protein n=1 Tax=Actinoalloteichus cyanogriseus TaxID=2893586 RepID=UPI0004BE8C05|nr:TetR family transcriptional regulator C-terminal domain-containing protein [Actinoalloteichus caeruleus]
MEVGLTATGYTVPAGHRPRSRCPPPEGEFGCADLEESAVHQVALIDGLALQWLRQAPPLTAEQARRHLHRIVETELRLRPTGD